MNEIAPATTLRDTWNAANPTEPLPTDHACYADYVEAEDEEGVVYQMENTTACPTLVQQLFDAGLS